MRNITLNIGADGSVVIGENGSFLGYGGEHNAAVITAELSGSADSVFSGAGFFRFVFDGKYSERLYLSGQSVTYSVPESVMRPPEVHAQLIAYTLSDGEPVIIAKSAVFPLTVGYSETVSAKAETDPDIIEKSVIICENSAESCALSAAASDASAILSEASAEAAESHCNAAETAATNAAGSEASAESSAAEASAYVTELSALAQLPQETANAVKKQAEGSTLFIEGVSSLKHSLDIKSDVRYTETETVLCDTALQNGGSVSFTGTGHLSVSASAFDETCGNFDMRITPVVGGTSLSDASFTIFAAEQNTYTANVRYIITGTVLSWSGEVTVFGTHYSDISGFATVPENSVITGLTATSENVSTTAIPSVDVTAAAVSDSDTPAVVTVLGRNVLPFGIEKTVSASGLTFSTDKGNLYLNGTATAAVSPTRYIFGSAFDLQIPAGTYRFSVAGLESSIAANAVICNESGISVCNLPLTNGETADFTATDGVNYFIGFSVPFNAASPVSADGLLIPIILEKVYGGVYYPAQVPQKAVSLPDGTVSGLKSVSPAMTVFTSEGNISVGYNADVEAFVQNSILEAEKNMSWELISDETVSEQIVNYTKTFNKHFKSLFINISVAADTSSFTGAGRIRFCTGSTGVAGQLGITNEILKTVSTPKMYNTRIDNIGGIVTMQTSWQNNTALSAYTTFSSIGPKSTCGLDVHGGMRSIETPYFSDIFVCFVDAAYPIPAGTKIKIYGVKA